MHDTPTIRLARESDVEGIASLIRELALELGWPRPEDAAETEAMVRRGLSACLAASTEHTVWVVIDSETGVVGYLAVHWQPYLLLPGPVGYVSELFVRAAWRGRGLGGSLLHAAETEAAQRGAFRLELFNKRDRASYERGFYAKAGWSERRDLAVFNRRVEVKAEPVRPA